MRDIVFPVLAVISVFVVGAGVYFLFTDTVGTGSVRGVQTENVDVPWVRYEAPGAEFSVEHPENFTVNPSYAYTTLGPNTSISGVSFSVPSTMTAGTNLSNDSYVSVERGPENCTARSFLSNVGHEERVTENEVAYTLATSAEGAAGNRYEEMVHIYPDCYAIRYFIHSTAVENYPTNTIEEFDREALLTLFDRVRRSFQPASKG